MSARACALHGLCAINKPRDLTSHDVVGAARHALHEKKIGHAGTLDPLATGVMIFGVGAATRLLGRITQDHKSYRARIAFGAQTSTDDDEGECIARAAVPDELLDQSFATSLLASFLGKSLQVPPQFCARSKDGVRAYMLARQGISVDLTPREIEVVRTSLVDVSFDDARSCPVWTVDFVVSKGTYIRALARDIGKRAGSLAYLAGLERWACQSVTLADCISLDELRQGGKELFLSRLIDPVRLLRMPVFPITQKELDNMNYGRALALSPDECARIAHLLSENERVHTASAATAVSDQGLTATAAPATSPAPVAPAVSLAPARAPEFACVRADKLYGIYELKQDTLVCKVNLLAGVAGVVQGGAYGRVDR